MMPFVYLLNGAPVFQPPGGGGNWTVNNLVVTGTLNVSGAATFSSSGSFAGNLTVSGSINPFDVGPGYTGHAGSIGVLGGNGLFIQGKTGTTYDFSVGNNGGSIAFGVPAGTTNVAVAGNLTVSGTGMSTFAGDVTINGSLTVSGGYISSATSSIVVSDSRNTVTTPQTINRSVVFDFKANATEGLNDGGSYFGEMTFRQYGSGTDWSGGKSHQLGFTDNDNIWHRSGTSTTWGTWYKLWHQNNDGPGSGLDADLLDSYQQDTTNVANTIVRRDGTGSFSAGTISAYASTSDSTAAGRTTALNVLTLESENTAALEYTGFGQAIVFRGSTYNNTAQRTLGRIVHKINDNSVATTIGSSIHFETIDNASNSAAPTEKFAINSGGILVTGTATATTEIQAPIFKDSANTAYYLDPASTADSALTIRGGALFGPNTTWSKYLMVGGDGRQNYTDNASVASVTTTNGNLHLDAASGYITYVNWYDGSEFVIGDGSNGYRLHINSSGNVGINLGGVSPTSRLQVKGSVSFGGDGSTGTSVSYGIYSADNSNSFHSTLVHCQSVQLALFANPQAYTAGTYYPAQTAGVGTISGVPLTFLSAGSEYMRITTGGNVGIGTTSPGYKLHVNGTIASATSGTAIMQLNSTSSGSKEIQFSNNGSVVGYVWHVSGYIGVGGGNSGNSLFVIPVSGNVGIGTATPSYKLDVNGESRLPTITYGTAWNQAGEIFYFNNGGSNVYTISTYNGAQAGNGYAGMRLNVPVQSFAGDVPHNPAFGFGDEQGVGMYKPASNTLAFSTANLCRLYINNSGNIGIGTTTPGYKLDVNGTIFASGSGFSGPISETGYRIKFYDNGGTHNDPGIGLAGAGGSEVMWFNALNGFYFNYGTANAKVTFDSSGNVGIGTSSPAYKLDVSGDLRVTEIGRAHV